MSNQVGGTKYVFAGTSERNDEERVKTCPRCGEMLFADMDVCYGCLYDFTKDAVGNKLPAARRKPSSRSQTLAGGDYVAGPLPRQSDPLEAVELDEVDDDPDDGLGMALDSPSPAPPSLPPRHSKRDTPTADDTLDLSAIDATTVFAVTPRPFVVVVSSADMCVSVPLPSSGLSVGRDEANDIVLRSRSISRNHLKLLPKEDAVLVEDCGATNPALVRGMPLSGVEALSDGETVTLCDVMLEVHARDGGAVG